MPKHTPGPWTVQRHSVTTEDGESLIASCSAYMVGVNANAQLIAAAPDMADALEVLLSRYVPGRPLFRTLEEARDTARAALRKAGRLG